MAILSVNTEFAGQVGVQPRTVHIKTNNTYAEVTAAGFLNGLPGTGYPLYPSDLVNLSYGSTSILTAIFTVSIDESEITLHAYSSEGNITLPVVSGNLASFDGTTGKIGDSGIASSVVVKTTVAAGQTIAASTSSATPGTIRAITGAMTGTNATMTSGNIVGVRGSVTCVGASGGFIYGTQGKVLPSGTLSGSVWVAGLFGQFDLSAATITNGQLAAVWADYGTTATAGTYTGARMYAGTNTTAAILNSQMYLYGGATNLLELVDNNALVGATYFVTAGTTAGSAGDTTKCNASHVLKITVNGTNYWLPLFASNS